MNERKPMKITRAQYLQLLGLEVIGKKHLAVVGQSAGAMAEIIDERDHDGSPVKGGDGGHMEDVIYGNRNLDESLSLLNVEVEE